jgi:hypothetical protein
LLFGFGRERKMDAKTMKKSRAQPFITRNPESFSGNGEM